MEIHVIMVAMGACIRISVKIYAACVKLGPFFRQFKFHLGAQFRKHFVGTIFIVFSL